MKPDPINAIRWSSAQSTSSNNNNDFSDWLIVTLAAGSTNQNARSQSQSQRAPRTARNPAGRDLIIYCHWGQILNRGFVVNNINLAALPYFFPFRFVIFHPGIPPSPGGPGVRVRISLSSSVAYAAFFLLPFSAKMTLKGMSIRCRPWCRASPGRVPELAFWISVFNILLCGTPKVRWRLKKTPFFK